MNKTGRPSFKLNAAKKMPPLYHKLPGKEFDPAHSECFAWIARQPQMLQYLFDKLAHNGYIEYDSATGLWKGADYED